MVIAFESTMYISGVVPGMSIDDLKYLFEGFELALGGQAITSSN